MLWLGLWCPHTDSNRGPTDYKSNKVENYTSSTTIHYGSLKVFNNMFLNDLMKFK